MSENKHTPEPWSVDPDSTDYCASILDANGADTILLGDYADWWMTKANARRVVACVNACAGCATEVLETAPVGFFNSTYGHPKYLEEITKQRDELLEQVECSNITEKNMEGRLNKLIVQNAATKDRLDEHRDGRLSALEKLAVAEKQRDELLKALERFATWARGQHRAQSKGCHATFDMMMLRDEIYFAEAAIAYVKGEQ